MRIFIIALLAVSLIFSGDAIACGGGGAGIQSSMTESLSRSNINKQENSPVAVGPLYAEETESFSTRHQIALEYALDNAKFQALLENAIISVELQRHHVPARAREITLAIKRQFDRIEYVEAKGLDFQFWHEAAAEVIEIVLLQTFPVLANPLMITKLATAFFTAYFYGFFFSEEAQSLPE